MRLAVGLSHAELDAVLRIYSNIKSVSLLRHDFPMIDGALWLARQNRPVVVTPITLAMPPARTTINGRSPKASLARRCSRIGARR